MKMAKASTADMNMALELCSALEALDMRCFPMGSEGDNDPEDFDLNDDAHCGQVLRHLHQVTQRGSIGRVIWGMYVMLDPENKLVNPDAGFLEAHPDSKDSARFRWLTEDHADPETRARCRETLERLPVMGYGAAVQLIDDAMAAPAAVGAV